MSSNRKYGLDFLKFICCFMVVCLHVPLPNGIRDIVVPISRMAVPIFFMITGYFYSFTKEREREKIQIAKMVKLLIGSNILYFTYTFALCFVKGNSVLSYFNIKNIQNFIFLNESPFGAHLWYLGAILYVLIIIYFFEKWTNRDKLYFLIPILLLTDLLLGKYSLLILKKEFPIIVVRNFLFVGLPYFLLGDFFFKKKINIKPKHLILLIIFFACTTLVERFLLEKFELNTTRDHYFSTSFLAVFAFQLACCNGNNVKNDFYKKCCCVGSKLSLGIYIIHPIIIVGVYAVEKILKNTIILNIYHYLAPLFVFIISILIVKAKKDLFNKFNFLNKNT